MDKRQKLTPPEVAKLWGLSPDKIVAWIRNGELRAIDGSTNRGERPRYLIDRDDLAEFERRRAIIATKAISGDSAEQSTSTLCTEARK